MTLLKRKIDEFLLNWKNQESHMPLIVKGCRQIGKTESIRNFGNKNYKCYIEINFILNRQFQTIFDNGYDVDTIIRNITFIDPSIKVEPNNTLIFFDEIQACVNSATSLKAFNIDGRYDVICSGSLMGINYKEIESNSVGNKMDYEMYSMDFEEFLWAKGYDNTQVNSLFQNMLSLTPYTTTIMDRMIDAFREFMVVGGMPNVVNRFITQKNYSGILEMQRQIILDYEEDITKYAGGLDKTKILNVYRKIPVFLGKDNKKFQVSKVAHGARNREYVGVTEWLENAGIINVCYNMEGLYLPIKGNYNPYDYKLYFSDTGLLIATLDDEAQEDLRFNRNFNTYKGAIYENVIGEQLRKQGYELRYYRNSTGTMELDFVVRDRNGIVPIEVKAMNRSTPSLNHALQDENVEYGIKFCNSNIGFDGRIYTFPYFTVPFLREYLKESK